MSTPPKVYPKNSAARQVSINEILEQLRQARGLLPVEDVNRVIQSVEELCLPRIRAVIHQAENAANLPGSAQKIAASLESLNRTLKAFANARNLIEDYIVLHSPEQDGHNEKRNRLAEREKASVFSKVNRILSNWSDKRYLIQDRTLLLRRRCIEHILTRHHPQYWSGKKKPRQNFLDKGTTVADIESIIQNILKQNRDQILATEPTWTCQFTGTVNGRVYTLGLIKGHIAQLYPHTTQGGN